MVRRFGRSAYDVLGLKPGASQLEIKSAFYKLAKTHHPDVNPSKAEQFKEIHKAYSSLLSGQVPPEDQAFDAGKEYEFRKQNRQEFYYSQTAKEEQNHEQDEASEPPPKHPNTDVNPTTWGREKLILGLVVGIVGLRVLFAEGNKQSSQRRMNSQYEIQVNDFAREMEADASKFEEYIRRNGLDKSVPR